MKKIIKTLLVVMVVVLALTAFVACNEENQCDHKCTQEFVAGYDATCTENGLRPGFKCPECGEMSKEQTVIEAYGHDMADATCTTPATCMRGDCTHTEGEALGHDMQAVEAVDGCTYAPGHNAHMGCTRCSYTEGKETVVVEHKMEFLVKVEPTCGKDGYDVYECAYCGGQKKGTTYPATGEHTWNDVDAKNPTCEEAGYTAHKECDVCGAKNDEYQVVGPHTVGDDGVCTGCGYTPVATAEELLTALAAGGKIWLDADVELDADATITVANTVELNLGGHTITATSDETGANRNLFDVNKGTLTVLNGTITLEHKGENMAWNNSTNIFNVTNGGVLNLKDATLKNLGGSDMAFVAHLNNWGEVTLDAENVTFESTYIAIRVFNSGNDKNNVTLNNCVVKGANRAFWVHNYSVADFSNDEAKAAAHRALLNFDIFNGTNEFVGSEERPGPVCYGFTDNVYLDAEGKCVGDHAYASVVTAPTCTAAGYTTYTCTHCGDTYKEDGEAALDHSYTDGYCTRTDCGAVDPDYYFPMTNAEALTQADGWKVEVKGTVCGIKESYNTYYKNMCVYIVDENGTELYIHQIGYELALGDVVTIKGVVGSYNNAKQIAKGATATVTGHDDSYSYVEKTVAEAVAAADGTHIKVTGTVVNVGYSWYTGSMSVTIAGEDGTQLYIYKLTTQVALNDVITVTGDMATYNGRQVIGATATVNGTHTCANYTEATCTEASKCVVCGTVQEGSEALGHKDDNKDHVCDNDCGVTQGRHADTDEDGNCNYCEKSMSDAPAEPTLVLEILPSDFNSTSYAANNGTHTKNGINYTTTQVYKKSDGTAMQWQKGKSSITIDATNAKGMVKIELAATAGTYTVTVDGTTVKGTTVDGVTTYDLTGLSGAIVISESDATGYTSYVKFYK